MDKLKFHNPTHKTIWRVEVKEDGEWYRASLTEFPNREDAEKVYWNYSRIYSHKDVRLVSWEIIERVHVMRKISK